MEIRDLDHCAPVAPPTDVLGIEWREDQDYPIFKLELENCSGFDKSHLTALLCFSSFTVEWNGDGRYRCYESRGGQTSEESSDLDKTEHGTGDEVPEREIRVGDGE